MAGVVRCVCQAVHRHFIKGGGYVENVRVGHTIFQTVYQDLKCLKTQAVDTALIEQASAASDEHEDDTEAKKEEEIERKRNKSRLNPHHRNLLHGKMPYSEPMALFHETVKYKRKMYGRYGHASGVNPGIMWPTREDLEEIKEYENVAYPYTIQELMTRVEEKKKEEQALLKAREEDLLKKYAKLEQWKNDVKDNAAKKMAAMEAAKAKKDRLVEEVRRHFGFKIDPRDDRFKELLEQKEKEEHKKAKEAKKKARQERITAKLEEQLQVMQEKERVETNDTQEKEKKKTNNAPQET